MDFENRPGSENRPSPRTSRKLQPAAPEFTELELRMAKQLKQVYTIERIVYESCRDGKASGYKPSPKWDGKVLMTSDAVLEDTPLNNVWVKVARDLHSKGIEPASYVRRVFSTLHGKLGTPPMPNQLLSPQAMRRYREGSENIQYEIELAYRHQMNLARQRIISYQTVSNIAMPDAVLRVLNDTTLSLSALLRYCLAFDMLSHGEGFKSLAEEFKGEAALQYMRHQEEYDNSWGSTIPVEFKLDAQRIYELSTR